MTSKLEDLIAELCPNCVEYKKIGDIKKDKAIRLISPSLKIKSNDYKNEGSVPIISQELEFISGYSDVFDPNIPNSEYVCFGDHSEHIKYVNFAFVQGADGLKIISVNNEVMLAKYFYYAISNYYVKHNNYERHFKYLIDTEIPVPPLDVQAEIVRILDTFTEITAKLTENLTAELTDRKKQYEYYRDTLLTFDDNNPLRSLISRYCPNGVEYKKIGDIALVTKLAGYEFTKYVQYSESGRFIALRGLNVKNGKLVLKDVKYIDNSDLSKLNRSKLNIGDMLFTYVGTIGQVALIDKNDKYYLAPNVALIRYHKENIIPKYMRYCFQSSNFVNNQINRLLQSSSMKNIPMNKIREFEVPVPPLEVQRQIVQILDRFDALCNDLTQGLPAEIEARRKQYEYYRDQLLTFKRA